MNLQASVSSLLHLPVDWIILGVIALVFAVETLRAGSGRVCAVALAIPLAATVFASTSTGWLIGKLFTGITSPYVQPILLLALFVIFYLLTQRILGFYGDSASSPFSAALVGVAGSALVVTYWLSVPSLEAVWHFSPQIQMIFGASYRFWWLTASYAALAAVRS